MPCTVFSYNALTTTVRKWKMTAAGKCQKVGVLAFTKALCLWPFFCARLAWRPLLG